MARGAEQKKRGLRLLPGLFALMLLFSAPGASALVNPALLYDQIEPHVDVIILRDDEIGITVQRTQQGSDIRQKCKGVPVTIKTLATSRTIAHTETVVTKDEGVAVFDTTKFRTGDQIKASRYFDIELTVDGKTVSLAYFHSDEMRAVSGKNILILLDQDVQKPYLREFTFNDRDVMFSQFTATVTPKNVSNHTFKAVLQAMGHTEALTASLCVGEKSKVEREIMKKTVSPDHNQNTYTFEFTDQWLNKLPVGKELILRWEASGKTYEYTSSLVLTAPVIVEPSTNREDKSPKTSFSMKDGKLQITVPTGVPFLAGFTFTLDVPKMPIMFYLDTSGEMMLGAVFTYGVEPFSDKPEKRSWQRTNNDKISDWMDESVEKFKKDIAKAKDNVNPEKGLAGKTGAAKNPSFELTFQIGGTMRGKNALTRNDPLTIESTIFASIEGKLKFKKQFMAGPVPFFIGAEISAGVEVVNTGVLYTDRKDPLKDMKSGKQSDVKPQSPTSSMKISGSLGVAVKLGIGIDGVAALPSITIAMPTDPAKPFPHYEFKMNFSLKAGVKILWVSYQIEPLSYDLLVADNWHKAPPSLPYWQDTKKKTAALSGGKATDDGGTMATDAEMEACCIAVLPEDYFATLQSAGSAVMQYAMDANGAMAGEMFQPYYPAEIPIAGVHLGSDTVLSDNIPYENDVIPYSTLDGEAREDGYGVVKPVDERLLIKDTYYNANIKTAATNQWTSIFYIANIKIKGEYVPTVMVSTLIGNELKHAIPILMDDTVPRYVVDYDMSILHDESNAQFVIDVLVAYSKGKDPAKSRMGLFNYKIKYDPAAQKLVTYAKQEIKVDTSYNQYKALHPRVNTVSAGRATIAWRMQYDMDYKSYTFTKPALCVVSSYIDNAGNVHWGEREMKEIDYPMLDLLIVQGQREEPLFLCTLSADRTLKTEDPFIKAYMKRFDQKTTQLKALEKVQLAVPNAYKAQRMRNDVAFVSDKSGSLYMVSNANTVLFTLKNDSMAMPVDYAVMVNTFNKRSSPHSLMYNILCYWGDSKAHTQGKADYPAYDSYDRITARRIILFDKGDGTFGEYSVGQDFTLCELDRPILKVKVVPPVDKDEQFCRLIYTYVPDVQGYFGNIYMANVPNVAALEITGMTTNDPCVGKGEAVGLFFDIKNSGNTLLMETKIELGFYRKDQTKPFATQEIHFDLRDANKIVAGVHELNFDRLAEGEMYVLDETRTLQAVMNTPALYPWFGQHTSFDSLTLSANRAAGSDENVRLKHLTPGEVHLYIDSAVMPKSVTGLVRIKARVIELNSDYEIFRFRGQGGNNATNGRDEYFVETTGGSTTVNYAHPVIEGSLVQDGDFGILTLNLRNENPDQMDMTLKIYGDDTLLMTKTFANICQGAALMEDAYDTALGYTRGTAGQSDAGYVNLIIPVEDLTQGQNFSYLRAELWPPEESSEMVLDGLEYDDIEFMLRTTDFLRVSTDLENQTVLYHEDATMTAAAAGGKAPYTFYWQKLDKDDEWIDLKRVDNQLTSSLILKAVSGQDIGRYRCLITDGADPVSTSEDTLTVIHIPAPVTGDGFPPALLIALCTLSAACALALLMIRKKGKRA